MTGAAGGNPGRPGPIRSLSGAHPYRPQCVIGRTRQALVQAGISPDLARALAVGHGEQITLALGAGRCPRCSGPLLPDPVPDGWTPAGTRALPCRCVPVCETCASWIEPVIGTVPVGAWPTDRYERDDDHGTQAEYEAAVVARIREQAGEPRPAVVVPGPDGPVLMTGTGLLAVRPRPHPGGWLEYGYDDDTRERQA